MVPIAAASVALLVDETRRMISMVLSAKGAKDIFP
jgi:hypothetical protein